MSRFPQVGYEMVVMGNGLFINPCHLPTFEATPDSARSFMLPSRRTGGYGEAVRQYFERSLEQVFPNHDDLIAFAGERLAESVDSLRLVTPNAFEAIRLKVMQNYDGIGLPRKAYGGETLQEAMVESVAEQYAKHMASERLSQPPRKVSAVDAMLVRSRDDLRRGRLHEAIRGRLGEYRQLGTNASLHELAQGKAIEIATGFESMMADDLNFFL